MREERPVTTVTLIVLGIALLMLLAVAPRPPRHS
jgi:hypothetical protein